MEPITPLADRIAAVKLLASLPSTRDAKEWKFQKSKAGIAKYKKTCSFPDDGSVFAHNEPSDTAEKPQTRVHGLLLRGSASAPSRYTMDQLLSPTFRSNHDPRMRSARILHRDGATAVLEYLRWGDFGAVIANPSHSIVRTFTIELNGADVPDDELESFEPLLLARLPDTKAEEVRTAIKERARESFNNLFAEALGTPLVSCTVSLAREEAAREYAALPADDRGTDSPDCDIYPGSGVIVLSSPKGCEVTSILFAHVHASVHFGEGMFASAEPLAALIDVIDAAYERERGEEENGWEPETHSNIDYYSGKAETAPDAQGNWKTEKPTEEVSAEGAGAA